MILRQIYVAPFLKHAVEKAVGVEVKLLNPPGGLDCVAVGAGDAGDPNTTGVTNAKEAKPPEVEGFDSVVPNPVDFCGCNVLIELAGALANPLNPPAIGLDAVVAQAISPPQTN